jgi:hydrogenase small subunit
MAADVGPGSTQEKSSKTPSERLLDALGPVEGSFDFDELGAFGLFAGATQEELTASFATSGSGTRLGPLESVHVFWFSGMSCDGCSVSVTGATTPSVEALLMGTHPGLPRIVLHHPVLNLESGPHYVDAAVRAVNGDLGVPYAIVLEGSIADETIAMETGGHWAVNGEAPWGPNGAHRGVTAEEWIARLAPGAAASIAIGTCATWGGIPAAHGNPTGAMSLMDFLGKDYRSSFGLPVVNVPGCPPVGDNFTETVAAVLYFLQGFGPLPEFDDLGRPAWLFGETVHRHCVRGAYYEEGSFAKEFGEPNCLVEIGCWGPVVNCNITSRGIVEHVGGCMNVGAPCVGCTMPGFPDKFTPRWKAPPGSKASTTVSRFVGSVIKPLRMYTNEHLNRETRWDLHHEVPSGWAREKTEPGPIKALGHDVYDQLRRVDDGSRNGHVPRGKRAEWTEAEEPSTERVLPGGEEA